MMCKAPQLGENEALRAEICAGLWGKKRTTYIQIASKKLFMVLPTTPLRQVGKNTNSIFEAVFSLAFIIPRNRQQKALQASCCLIQGLCTP
jgi:hypothetical protein